MNTSFRTLYASVFGEEALNLKLLANPKFRKSLVPKKEYIILYGEEAWNERKRKNEQWKINNPEKDKQSKIKYAASNKNKVKASQLKYKEEHPDRYKEIAKKYRDNHKEKRTEENKKYRKTLSGRASSLFRGYNIMDKKRGFDISDNITTKEIISLISNGKCIYCGDTDWQHLGCDRIDNNKPHTPDNIVCACGICNIERADKYSMEDFIQYRKLHPRSIDIKKAPLLNEKGALVKRAVN